MTKPANIKDGRFWDFPWSLVEGCSPVSPGCAHCWSAAMEARFKPQSEFLAPGAKAYNGHVVFREDRLSLPTTKKGSLTFAVWTDFFHDAVTTEQRLAAFRVMAACPQHTFILLTKRALNLHLPDKEYGSIPWPLENVWFMVTCENQYQIEHRGPALCMPGQPNPWALLPEDYAKHQRKGHVGISVEPMLGPVDISNYPLRSSVGLEFVVCGPETGPGKRPCDPAWIQDLYEQCRAADIAFFDKRKDNPLARDIPWND